MSFLETVLRIPSKWELPVFVVCMMGLFRLPCGKLPLTFLAVPAGKDGRVECPCQTFDGFIGIRGSVCGLFLFVSNARSFDRPTVAKPGEKIKVPIFIRRKGADAFRPALAAGAR